MVASTTFRAREAKTLNRSRAKTMRHDPVYVERLFWSYLRIASWVAGNSGAKSLSDLT